MPLYTTPDGRYTVAWQTPGEGDGNSVIYDRGPDLTVPWPGTPVWDRFSHEAALGTPSTPVRPAPAPVPATPVPATPSPATPVGSGRLLPVTNASDGRIVPREYSYWSNCWIGADAYYVFCGTSNGPQFFAVDRQLGAVTRMGNLVPYGGETEGWYWDAAGWIYLIQGPQLHRVNPFTGADTLITSIEDAHPGCDLWQAHSSDDGRVHSATVRQIRSDGPYLAVGTLTVKDGQQFYVPSDGDLDESQVDATGRYVVIKEHEDNRIIDLQTRETRWIRDADGAVGHSDMGPALLVGEDNIHGACVRWDLDQPLVSTRRRELFSTWGMGHLSIRGGRCLLSDATHLSLVDLNGNGVTPLLEHGMVGSDYDRQVKAAFDPSGQIACFRSNRGTDRDDVFLLEIPR